MLAAIRRRYAAEYLFAAICGLYSEYFSCTTKWKTVDKAVNGGGGGHRDSCTITGVRRTKASICRLWCSYNKDDVRRPAGL